jgi:hypothetical protein
MILHHFTVTEGVQDELKGVYADTRFALSDDVELDESCYLGGGDPERALELLVRELNRLAWHWGLHHLAVRTQSLSLSDVDPVS